MSVTEAVYINTELDPTEVVEMFFKGIGYKAKFEQYSSRGLMIVYAETPEFVAFPERIPTKYPNLQIRIKPTVSIRIDSKRDVDREQYMTHIVQATLELIHTTGKDIAMEIQNGDYVALIHQSGDLVLNKNLTIWTSDRLKLVKMPYTMEAISS